MKQVLFSILMCVLAIACGQSDKKENTSAVPSDSLSNLINPVSPSPTDAIAGSSSTPVTGDQTTETLQHSWVLDSINGQAINTTEFKLGTPYLDIKLDSKTITGHAGCNGLKGRISVSGKKVRVDSLVSTKIACESSKFENGLLNTLRSRSLVYEIKNGILYLKSSGSQVYIFRKIRV